MDDGSQSVRATVGEKPDRHDRLTASFGIMWDKPYDPSMHKGEEIERDPVDRKQYAIYQINWFLKKGQTVYEAGMQQPVRGDIELKHLDDPWQLPVVTSDLPSSKLPTSLFISRGGARLLYYLEFRPDPEAVRGFCRLKKKYLYRWKPKYYPFCLLNFQLDASTRKLSITNFCLDGIPIPSSNRIIWVDPENLNDGCSTLSIPPPMYCLTRPESTAASLFERIAEQRARRENRGQEGEDDTISADENHLGDRDGEADN